MNVVGMFKDVLDLVELSAGIVQGVSADQNWQISSFLSFSGKNKK